MPSFTPPSTNEVPPVLPETRGVARSLFRHYRARPAGINVFIYSDGTVSEVEPDGQSRFQTAALGSPYVTACFYGGHDAYEVTDAQAALLTGAGYTVD